MSVFDPRRALEAGDLLAEQAFFAEPQQPDILPMLEQRGIGPDIGRALLAALEQMPPPSRRQGAGGAFLRGLASGYGTAAVRRDNERLAENERRTKVNEQAQKDYSQAARDLRERRTTLWRESRKPQAAEKPDFRNQPITPEFRKQFNVPESVKTTWEWEQEERRREQARIAADRANTDRARVLDDAAEDQEAKDLGLAVATGRIRPSQIPVGGRSARFGAKVRLAADMELRGPNSRFPGKSLAQLNLWEDSAKQFQRTMDTQRMTTWRMNAVTVAQHLEEFKKVYDKWADDYHKKKPNPMLDPGAFAAWNQGLLNFAREGYLGGAAQEEVAPLAVNKDLLAREVSLVMAGGFAPFEADAAAAVKDLVPLVMSPKATRRAIDQLDMLVGARIKNNVNALPYFGGGDNPYLDDVSPLRGWEEGKRLWRENPGVWGDVTDAERFRGTK